MSPQLRCRFNMLYVSTPKTIRIKDILTNQASFSPHNYNRVIIDEESSKTVREFLSGEPLKGEEVGSSSYIPQSHKFFVRTKALQQDSFLLDFTKDSIIPILPSKFIDNQLLEHDIIISKDSNIGETIVLDQDYPDFMLSNGLYKLPVNENKYYLLAFLKHPFFKTQLNFLVSRGATIRHAKTLFLDCKIPFPKKNKQAAISEIEKLTKSIIEDEKAIRIKEKAVFDLIDAELNFEKRIKEYKYSLPSVNDIGVTSRIDAGFYCEDYKSKQWLIANYKNGSGTLENWKYDIGRGQNLQVSAIGKSIYSNEKKKNFYTLARPTNLSDFGTVMRYEYLGNQNELSIIQPGDIIFSAEGSIGKCVMFVEPGEKVITNIHGIILNKKDHDTEESGFVCSFLRYLRKIGVLDYISVGGQGGSLAMKYLHEVKIPYFPEEQKSRISQLYHRANTTERADMGILELDDNIKAYKARLNKLLEDILSQQT